jgi:target of EGR1 protein 1
MKFVADLDEIFSAGLYDTKYIADFHDHSPASFLEYLYKKALHLNSLKINKNNASTNCKYIEIEFVNKQSKLSEFRFEVASITSKQTADSLAEKICNNYAMYGFCAKIEKCNKSHDINLIIQTELNTAQNKKNRKNKKNSQKEQLVSKENNTNETNISSSLGDNNFNLETANNTLTCSIDKERDKFTIKPNQTHNAGLDAFMTGYVMLNYINKFAKFNENNINIFNGNTKYIGLNEIEDLLTIFRNNIYLVSKFSIKLINKKRS